MAGADKDGGWGWIVLTASFLCHLMVFGLAWSTGVYNVVFLEAFSGSRTLTAWIGSLPAAILSVMGPLSSVLTNKYGCRNVVIAGGIISSVGLSTSYFATNLYFLLFTFGIVTGAGCGLIYIPAITTVTYYFDRKLSLAAGIAVSGIGVGNFLYPALIRWLIHVYNWQQSLLILGAIMLNVCVCGALMRPVVLMEIKADNRQLLDISPFKKKGYLFLCVNNFCFMCGISAMYIQLAAQADTLDINANLGAMLISGIGVSNLFGRVAFGVLGQHRRMNPTAIYGVSFAVTGVVVCIVPLCRTFPGLLCCSVAFGFLSGSLGPLLTTILVELLGRKRFANGYGCILLFEAAGQLTGGPLSGALYDLTDSYTLAFVIGGCLCMVSAVVMIYPYWYSKRRSDTNSINKDAEAEKLAPSLDLIVDNTQRNIKEVPHFSSASFKKTDTS